MTDKKLIKIFFAGTPDFAVPFLQALIDSVDFEVVGVITQPDKPTGRKQKILPSPIKILAINNNIKVIQPNKLTLDSITAEADAMAVVAYGQIISQSVLDLFKFGVINFHPSLLPKYRGASPIQSTILNGEKQTGVSIMLMDNKIDHGATLTQKTIKLTGFETNESLHQDIAKKYADFFVETIKKYIGGKIKPQPQDDNQATYCQPINKAEAQIDWHEPSKIIERKIRAFNPWPIAWTNWNNKRLKIFKASLALSKGAGQGGSGLVFEENGKLSVQCGKGYIEIHELQLEGKNKINANDFLAGNKEIVGTTLK